LFIILDFACGRYYTHHSSYLKDFADHLVINGQSVRVLVNSSADKEVFEILSPHAVSPVLDSNMYSHVKNNNLIGYYKNKLINFVLNSITNRIKIYGIDEIIKKIVAKLYLKSALKFLNSNSFIDEHTILVFPTLDALGLRLVELLVDDSRFSLIKFCVRLTGAEKRGSLGVLDSIERLKKISLDFPQKINIGCEVENFKFDLQKKGIAKQNLYWAPMPYIRRKVLPTHFNQEHNTKLKIGFLGSARENKGFDSIPLILLELVKSNVNFHAYIQEPNFSWIGALETIDKLKNIYASSVTFIQGGTRKNIIDSYVSEMDYLILPYSKTDYTLCGSGIFYIACDYLIPCATNQFVSFGREIQDFKIGIVYKNFSELSRQLSSFLEEKKEKEINNYNIARNKSLKLFFEH